MEFRSIYLELVSDEIIDDAINLGTMTKKIF
jgi:hypothetical protein